MYVLSLHIEFTDSMTMINNIIMNIVGRSNDGFNFLWSFLCNINKGYVYWLRCVGVCVFACVCIMYV